MTSFGLTCITLLQLYIVEKLTTLTNRKEVAATTTTTTSSSSDEQETRGGASASSSSRTGHYNRHTPYQTQELENYFKMNSHPNEKQRAELGRKLNIEINKIKFWFQNRRTQLKNQTERHEKSMLKHENEQLKLDILATKEAAKNMLCSICGGQATIPDKSIQEQKLLIENVRLKDEITNMTSVVNQMMGKMMTAYQSPTETHSVMSFNTPIQRNTYLEHASNAMEELHKLGMLNVPFWSKNIEGGGETLNFEEYVRAFSPCLGPKPVGFLSEATRASGVVSMTCVALVEALMNVHQWREMFVGMIGSCSTMEVISNGIGGSRNGALQLMKAEIQIVSSLVPVRVVQFIRLAKKRAEGVWIVVDLSTDYGIEGQLTRRCPSGCIIHDMSNGFSKVTWIEHTEYDEQLLPQQYRWLIRSGVGFGAQRWISALLRHCEGLKATLSPTLNHHLCIDTKRSLKCLAQRMTSIFCAGVCLSGGEQWAFFSHAPGRSRIMARECISSSGEPLGIIASATSSVWIAVEHRHLFDLLLTKHLRYVWDVICHRIAAKTMVQFSLGQDETSPNSISLLSSDETSSDMTGSLIVYATVDLPTVSLVMNGGDTSPVALLPSGLCIVPGYTEGSALCGECGSMVTVGFQILLPGLGTSHLTLKTVSTINDLVSRTILGIQEIVRFSQQ
ncbi:hypothetical protein QVD17_29116 [Tagetes erecta]|uniref:Uncharacterized protein n=1 Tax=Tagetes erecta TaxID=13708 RepID=A0AAD8KBN7_TARER|nr:hypothetical protein QVD17_29116 [Tagetes erecta]